MCKVKLTIEQQQIVELNHNLIYGYATKRNLDLEEWYGLLAIELCKTIPRWDESKGSLSTIYYIRCDRLTQREYNKGLTQKRNNGGLLSLDYEYEFSGQTLEDLIIPQDDNDLGDLAHNNEFFDRILKGEHGKIIKLRYEGYTQQEIADIVGMSQVNVGRIITNIYNQYNESRRDEDY